MTGVERYDDERSGDGAPVGGSCDERAGLGTSARTAPRVGTGAARPADGGRRSRGRALLAVGALLAGGLLAPAGEARGQEVITQDEALRLAFPDADVERRTAFLDEDQMRRASELAGPDIEIDEPLVTYYVGSRGDSVLGISYFDAHTVRTLPEVLMVAVTPGGEVSRVEVLKFNEPQKYRPPEGWLGEFRGMGLSRELSAGRGVVTITGATLTTRAVTRAVRRVLALHDVIAPVAPDDGEAGP